MQAIVLAAGYGRRMRPLTDDCHKALLPVGGTTILARIVDSLVELGVTDVTVVTGYRASDVTSYLVEYYPAMRFQFIENVAYAETNNIVSLALALDQMELADDVLLIECDLLFETRLLRRLVERQGNVALVDHYRSGMDGTVVSVMGGFVTNVYPPHLQDASFSYADKFKTLNIYRFSRTFIESTLRPLLHVYAHQIDGSSYYELVLGMLANIPAHRIAAEIVAGDTWIEVDDPNDLAVARFRFEPEQRAATLDRAQGGDWALDVQDFAFMRNVHFPTDGMIAALRHALPDLLKRYGSTQVVLNEKLGLAMELTPARLQILHGATQGFPLLRDLVGDEPIAIPTPSFGEYPRMFGHATTYGDDGDVSAILDRLAERAAAERWVTVVNPNNPTGTTLPSASLHALAKRFPGTRFLVDESFIDFSGETPLATLLEREPLTNVVVLVSMSKTLGVPGLRLGYLYSCDPEVVAAIGAALPIWNMSAISEYFLELIPKFRLDIEASVAQTISDRAELRAMLTSDPEIDAIWPSGGNFMLVKLRGSAAVAQATRQALLVAHSLDVKNVSSKFGDGRGWLRLGVRTSEENVIFAGLLRDTLAAAAS